jgi:hypothetical protein
MITDIDYYQGKGVLVIVVPRTVEDGCIERVDFHATSPLDPSSLPALIIHN